MVRGFIRPLSPRRQQKHGSHQCKYLESRDFVREGKGSPHLCCLSLLISKFYPPWKAHLSQASFSMATWPLALPVIKPSFIIVFSNIHIPIHLRCKFMWAGCITSACYVPGVLYIHPGPCPVNGKCWVAILLPHTYIPLECPLIIIIALPHSLGLLKCPEVSTGFSFPATAS